ncbi:MAG TPA: type 4a pilus biogenesis protein PilO [Phycisphaerae bacterium]|nr:type 4a pilus biogenesis protein PilO [Phycisphaerae bacterium]
MRFSRDNWIVLGILTVILVTYVAVVHRWQSSCLEDLQGKIAARKRQHEADAAKAARVAPMMREIQAMKHRYNNDWNRRLPESQELAGFLREISANLAEEKLSRPMIAPGDPSRGSLYNVLPITMKFEGDFLSLAGFLRRVDGMTRLTRIEQLSIHPQQESNDLAIVLGMNIYFTEQ